MLDQAQIIDRASIDQVWRMNEHEALGNANGRLTEREQNSTGVNFQAWPDDLTSEVENEARPGNFPSPHPTQVAQ